MSRLASAVRHSWTRRWSVRSCPSENVAGCATWRRWKSSLAVRSGSASSQRRTRGQACSKGSTRVRQSRDDVGGTAWVGLTSPFCQAVLRLFRNVSSSGSQLAGSAGTSPAASAARWPCIVRISLSSRSGSREAATVRSLAFTPSGTASDAKSLALGVAGR